MIAPVLEQMNDTTVTEKSSTEDLTSEEIELGNFAKTVLADTEDIWTKIFKENNLGTYPMPKMVLFSEMVHTECGGASSASVHFIVQLTKLYTWI